MNISGVNNNYGVNSLYNMMYQSNVMLSNNKLTSQLFSKNKIDATKSLGEEALKFVTDLKTSSKNLSSALNELSGTAFTKKTADTKEKDLDYAKSKIEDLVNSYNDLYSAAVQKTEDPKAQKLASRMLNVAKTSVNQLSSIGINFDKDGKMTIDTKQLDEAAQNGKLEKFFTENRGKNYGFTNQLANLANSISRNTANYVSSSQFGSSLMENFSYSGFGQLKQYDFLSSGLVFDYSL